MSKTTKVRTRCPNFTQRETETLVSIAERYTSIIENKRSDALTCQQKDEAWAEIAQQFNQTCDFVRTEKNIRTKYESLRKMVRKKSASIKKELCEPGNEPLEVGTHLNPTEERLKSMIQQQKLPDEEISHDSESNEQSQPIAEQESVLSPYHTQPMDEDYTRWRPSTLRVTNNTPPPEKRAKTSSTLAIYDRLAEAKLELVQLQLELARNEDRRQEEAHQNNERRREEEHRKRMDRLDRDFNEK